MFIKKLFIQAKAAKDAIVHDLSTMGLSTAWAIGAGIGIVFLFIAAMLGIVFSVYAILGLILSWAWNIFAVPVLGWPPLTFWQGLGLIILLDTLRTIVFSLGGRRRHENR